MSREITDRFDIPPYQSRTPWNPGRPHILVVACSDGRLQENLDDFLEGHLRVTRYDRLYAPGGPGALTAHGIEFLRSDQFRREFAFLVKAHEIEEIILIFHGPASDGPENALCADYRRIYPRLTAKEVGEQQEKDALEIVRAGFGWSDNEIKVSVYRCEVTNTGGIQFSPLKIGI